MATAGFFDVSKPIDRETFLKITREILQASLLILAPFGLPGQLRQAVRTEDMFVRKYGPRFRFILESVSEIIYEARGVSESEVAVTLHKYTEEEKDDEALACLAQMNEALRSIYSPPRLLELPYLLSMNNLVRSGLSMLHAGAIYTPGPVKRSENTLGERPQSPPSSESCQTGGELPSVPTDVTSGDADALPPCVAYEARNALARFSYRLQEASVDPKTDSGDMSTSLFSSQRNVGIPDYEKLRRAKVASCLDAMATLRKGTEGFLESIEQPHLQAMTEAFRARCTDGSLKDSGSTTRDSSSHEASHSAAVIALDEIAVMSFMDNELLMLIRELGERCEQKVEAFNPSGVEGTDETPQDPEAMLESVLTSQFYRMIAEQYLEEDSPQQAARWYDEAYSVGASLLPARSKAELLAERARCYLIHERDFEAAISKADAALAVDAACGEAFLVRGQCRRALRGDQGALGDLVKAFVLRGSALNGMTTDNGEAQAIEEVSREACKARAVHAFSVREVTNTFPADWVVRSYLASYNREDLYSEQENSASRRPLEDQEPSSAVSAFWRGISLMQKERFTESMMSFAGALNAEDLKIRSLALEHYGSFQYLQRNMNGSLESFRLATVADPTNAKCWVKKGSVLNDLGRSEEATQLRTDGVHYRESAGTGPVVLKVARLTGAAFSAVGLFVSRDLEALECFRAAQKIDPEDPDLYLHRGQGHLLANSFRTASMDLKKSVDLCPTMPISWATWGIALFKLGTTDEQSSSSVSRCLEVMEDALERFPENSEVILFFAEVLVSIGNFARGLELLKRSALLDPECPLPYVNAARAYLGMNDLVAARRHLERGQELDSTYPGTFMDMGQLLMQEGFPAKALSMYARGVETARFPSEIHDAMASFEVAKCHLEAQQLLPYSVLGL